MANTSPPLTKRNSRWERTASEEAVKTGAGGAAGRSPVETAPAKTLQTNSRWAGGRSERGAPLGFYSTG